MGPAEFVETAGKMAGALTAVLALFWLVARVSARVAAPHIATALHKTFEPELTASNKRLERVEAAVDKIGEKVATIEHELSFNSGHSVKDIVTDLKYTVLRIEKTQGAGGSR